MRGSRLAGLLVCLAAWPNAAHANFHLWLVNEVFSNADGTVQFVEFDTGTDFQNLVGTHAAEFLQNGAVIASAPFGMDLATTLTAGHSLLIATPDFQAAAGIEPDFLMPASSIPVASVDGVRMSLAPLTEFDFTAGTLPLDGVHSLNRDSGVAVATPTNFAGEVGTLSPEPASVATAAMALGALGGLSIRRGRASLRR
jgi:serralysin